MKITFALLLIFSLLVHSGNLHAEKRGCEIEIVKKDGLPVKGELIAVKEDSLVILENDSKADVSVALENIQVIKVMKKSKAILGVSLGILVGGVLGSLYGTSTDTYDSELRPVAFMVYGGGGAALGALIGGFLGASAGKDKTYIFEGSSYSEIQKILDELRKKSRVSDFK